MKLLRHEQTARAVKLVLRNALIVGCPEDHGYVSIQPDTTLMCGKDRKDTASAVPQKAAKITRAANKTNRSIPSCFARTQKLMAGRTLKASSTTRTAVKPQAYSTHTNQKQ